MPIPADYDTPIDNVMCKRLDWDIPHFKRLRILIRDTLWAQITSDWSIAIYEPYKIRTKKDCSLYAIASCGSMKICIAVTDRMQNLSMSLH